MKQREKERRIVRGEGEKKIGRERKKERKNKKKCIF
jgi:hypothetical protein